MAKQHHSPLLGYNNNVRHKARVFHIQTEDSGIKHPHIITHLFMDGGRILKSVKKSYAEHIGSESMADTVRQMMKEQHKAMFIALRDGQFDQLVDEHVSATGVKNAAQASSAKVAVAPTAAESGPNLANLSDIGSAPALPPDPSSAPVLIADNTSEIVDARAKTEAAMPVANPDQTIPMPVALVQREEPPPPPPPAPARTSKLVVLPDPDEIPATTRDTKVQELTLDIDALERAAQESPAQVFRTTDLPPPPRNLFKDKPTTGSYRTLEPVQEERPAEPVPDSRRRQPTPQTPGVRKSVTPSPQVAKSVPKSPPSRPGQRAGQSVGSGRYAPARPAAIFGQSKPQPSSIFGDDLISDKSLDEVILSYLAEDLEPPKKR